MTDPAKPLSRRDKQIVDTVAEGIVLAYREDNKLAVVPYDWALHMLPALLELFAKAWDEGYVTAYPHTHPDRRDLINPYRRKQ